MLTEKRILQIKEALKSYERPSTYKEVGEIIGINKTHIGRLISGNTELFILWSENKRYHREQRIKERMKNIEEASQKYKLTISDACLKLGYSRAYYHGLRVGR